MITKKNLLSSLITLACLLPAAAALGQTPGDIVGISIACFNDKVYVWYSNRTLSIGTSENLSAHPDVNAVAAALVGDSSVLSQLPGSISTPRPIKVTAQKIRSLSRGKNYVVDLTQRGVKYEFDPKAGQIDFSRVRVRTAQGEVRIGTLLETKFLKGKLAGFKWASQPFSLRTQPARTLQPPPAVPPSGSISEAISCSGEICTCIGDDSCDEMIDLLPICNEVIFCKVDPISRQTVCSCAIRS